MKMRKVSRRFFLPVAICLLVALIGGRIWYVNQHAIFVPTYSHELDEWIDLDGSFVSVSDEDTFGYSLKVSNARMMTRRDYFEFFSVDSSDSDTGISGESFFVVVLDIDVKNQGNADGYINYKNWRLSPPARNTAFYIDYDLWYEALPELNSGKGAFGVTEGTTVTLHVPFWHFDSKKASLAASSVSAYGDVVEGSYEFILTNMPRHTVFFTVE